LSSIWRYIQPDNHIEYTNMGLPFHKMHGLGNDFVVIDARHVPVDMTPNLARLIADRHFGVGFDQLALITGADHADFGLVFYNADGSQSAACGNATRCVARHVMGQTGQTALCIQTAHGVLAAHDAGGGMTSVNMGPPVLNPAAIPIAPVDDIDHLPIAGNPIATGMGNPHCTFFVNDATQIDLAAKGPKIEHHPLFPQRTNVQFASLIAPNHLRVRVWERGAGVTMASGSSSCAVAVAAMRRGLTGRQVMITLDGGDLQIDWRDDGVWMTGPSMHVFSGILTQEFLQNAGAL
jgi:diaminopimelate epimerase